MINIRIHTAPDDPLVKGIAALTQELNEFRNQMERLITAVQGGASGPGPVPPAPQTMNNQGPS